MDVTAAERQIVGGNRLHGSFKNCVALLRCRQGGMRSHTPIWKHPTMIFRKPVAVACMLAQIGWGQFLRRRLRLLGRLNDAMQRLRNGDFRRGRMHAFPIAVKIAAKCVHGIEVPPAANANECAGAIRRHLPAYVLEPSLRNTSVFLATVLRARSAADDGSPRQGPRYWAGALADRRNSDDPALNSGDTLGP